VTAAEIVNALTGSAILAAAVREGWRWYTARAARGDAAKAAADGSVAGLLREQITAGEARAEKSAERAVAIAGALDASARAVGDVRVAIDRVPAAITAEADRTQMRLERIELLLTEIRAHVAPPTGEYRAGAS
jgi:hypothetical protein